MKCNYKKVAATQFADAAVIDVISMLLGLVVLTHFFSLLVFGFFTPAGFSAHLMDNARYIDGWSAGKYLLPLLIKVRYVLAPLLGAAMMMTAACLILLIGRSVAAIGVGLGYFIAWHLLWDYPGMWTFEFLFPALFGLCVGLASLNKPFITSSIYQKLGLSKTVSVIIILLSVALLYYITSIAFLHHLTWVIAVSSASAFFLLSLFSLVLDKKIVPNNNDVLKSVTPTKSPLRYALADLPWLEIMIIIIGAMMIMQDYSNYYSGLFTVEGHSSLAKYYASASGSHWLRPFLAWSGRHSYLLMPLQIVFEVTVAILLVLVIFSGPVLLLSAGLFGLLAFAELGVSAQWPPVRANLTWEWELMLVTGVSIAIGWQKFNELFHATSLKQAFLGKKIFGKISPASRWSIPLVGALALYCVGMVTHVFGDQYRVISLSSAITF
jgi:hypothetical protein